MPTMDLNADMAEGDALGPDDLAMLAAVTSASLACGFHAGSPSVMRSTADVCVERGVVIGAHVSYRDRAGFGRRAVVVAPDRLAADLVEQWDTLAEVVGAAGGTVTFVKPHGALYSSMATDPEVAEVVVGTLGPRCGVLVGPPSGAHVAASAAAGTDLVPEGFCDRGYRADGSLVTRGDPGDLVDEPTHVAQRARALAVDGGIGAVDGTWVALTVRTICLHGDRPGSATRIRAVRQALESAGVSVRSFAAPDVHR